MALTQLTDLQPTNIKVTGIATFDQTVGVDGNVIGDNATNISGINSVTATTFYGNGANLSGITGTTINSNADGRVITGSNTANTLNANGNFTYSNQKVSITGSQKELLGLQSTHSEGPQLSLSDSSGAFAYLGSAKSLFTGGSVTDLGLRTANNISFGINGNEKLRIDSSGRLGIGITNPDTLLHLNASSGSTLQRFQTSSYSSYIAQIQANDNVSTGAVAGDLHLRGQSGVSMSANNGTATHFRIESGGDIKLNQADSIIHTGADTSRLRLFGGSSNSVNNGAALTLQGVSESGGNYADLASGTGGFVRFRTGTNERLRITSGGAVGIAQTNPSKARLHVVGDNTSGDIVAKFKSGGGGADSETYIALVTGYPDDVNDYEGHAHIGVQRNGASNGTSIIFKPHSGSGTSVTERMRISPSGTVTKAQQPYVFITGITNTGGSGNANNGTATTYGAISYSSGRVTAQVEGNYLITFSSISDNGTGRVDARIRVNGNNIAQMLTSNNGTGYRQKGASIVYHLNVNDYVDWNNDDWYAATNTSSSWRTASVYLLG